MADIKDRIKSLGTYFNEMKVASGDEQQYIYVTVIFPHEWMLDENTEQKFGVGCSKENGLTYFWADLSNDFNTVFDAIDYNIKVNKEAQEKVILFNEKLNELKDIFSNESNTLEKLKTLKFIFEEEQSKLPFTPAPTEEKKSKKKSNE